MLVFAATLVCYLCYLEGIANVCVNMCEHQAQRECAHPHSELVTRNYDQVQQKLQLIHKCWIPVRL